jgi:hypothetical protein
MNATMRNKEASFTQTPIPYPTLFSRPYIIREKAHEEVITAALTAANASMDGSRPYAAVRELEAVLTFVSPLLQRGEDVRLLLPCAYEGIGQHEKVSALYRKLRKVPFLIRQRQM